MGIFNKFLSLFSLSKAQAANGIFYRPYKMYQINFIYNLLFCDKLELYKNNFKGEAVAPWSVLFSPSKNSGDLEKIVNDPKCESRVKILTYYELMRLWVKLQKKELLGVIVEARLNTGLDTLAAYADRTSRYINYTGKMIIWETKEDVIINDKIVELFQKSEQVVSNIGPWDKDQLPPPKKGLCRITFLVSDGLYFGQGTFNALLNDPMSGPVLNTATALMNLLINKSLNK